MYPKISLLLLIFIIGGFQKTLNAQQSGDNYLSIADSLFDIDQYEIARENFRRAKSIFESNLNWEKACESLNGIINTTIYEDQYENVVSELQLEFIAFISDNPILESINVARGYYLLAYSKEKLGRYSNALEDYERAIDIYETLDFINHKTSYAYRNAAQIALRMLDYSKAVEYFKKGLKDGSDGYYYASICGQLAKTYHFLNDFDEQYKYIQLGQAANPRPSTKAILQTSLAGYLLERGNYKEAEKNTLEALEYCKQKPQYWENTMSLYLLLVKVYEKQKLDKKAKQLYAIIEKEVLQKKSAKNRDKAALYVKMAERYFENGITDQSLQYFQKALIQVFPDFNETDIFKNPPVTDIYKESWIMDAAAGKAKALKKRFVIDGDIKNLQVAAECYDLVIAEINALNKSYGTEASKIYLGDYGYTYFEEAIDIRYLLNELTGDEKYLNEILALMEVSKAVVLSEAIQKNKAIFEAAIPDSLLRIEKEGRIAIAEKNIELIEYKQAGEIAKINSIELELSDLLNDYGDHLAFLKKQYPKFQSLTENFNPPTVKDVQSYIAEQSTILIEYFVGQKNIYALIIGEEEVNVRKIEKTENANQLITDFLSYFKNANQFLDNPDAYLKTAYRLYSTLFPDLSDRGISYKNIIIIPDGELKRIPFEALVDQSDLTGIYNTDHYLLNKYLIYYSNSVRLLLDAKRVDPDGEYFLKVAPGFLNHERGLTPLAYSEHETQSIGKMVSLRGEEATLTSFKEKAENGKLIHFSTHASAGTNGEVPRIEFIDTTLLLPEIYALNLKADLVVLSTCESQLGEFKKGEGVMSLGRGFFYAGAASLVASLWSVNEQSTAEIFAGFYKQLQQGKSKANALQIAKSNYLVNTKSDLKKSPYYWAGFVYLGKNKTIDMPLKNEFPKIGMTILLGIFFLGLVYYYKKFNT